MDYLPIITTVVGGWAIAGTVAAIPLSAGLDCGGVETPIRGHCVTGRYLDLQAVTTEARKTRKKARSTTTSFFCFSPCLPCLFRVLRENCPHCIELRPGQPPASGPKRYPNSDGDCPRPRRCRAGRRHPCPSNRLGRPSLLRTRGSGRQLTDANVTGCSRSSVLAGIGHSHGHGAGFGRVVAQLTMLVAAPALGRSTDRYRAGMGTPGAHGGEPLGAPGFRLDWNAAVRVGAVAQLTGLALPQQYASFLR